MGEAESPRAGAVSGSGVTLRYREWSGPAERPPILLLHGLASSSAIWDLTAPLLARARRVVALDQRGHGESEKPDTGYDFATIVADDLAAVDALGLGPRFVVIGHSWGANAALEFAAAHPARVAALILVDGGFGMLRQRPGATWEQISRDLAPPDYAGTPRSVFLERVRGSVPNYQPAIDDIMLRIVQLRDDDTVGPRLVRANHLRILRAMWDEEPDRVYPRVTAPTLFILARPPGATDATDGFLAAKELGMRTVRDALTAAPRVAVEWLAETVHDIPLQRPATLAERILAFIG